MCKLQALGPTRVDNIGIVFIRTRDEIATRFSENRSLDLIRHVTPLVQCDGNDIFAVVKVMKDAIKRAREDQRPTFIEGLTYRIGDHTTADDARRYRDQKELEEWKAKDPLVRLGNYLRKKKLWDDKKEAALQDRAKAEVTAVVERAEHIAAPAKSDMFDSMYAELPDELRVQRETMRTSSLGQDPSQVAQSADAS